MKPFARTAAASATAFALTLWHPPSSAQAETPDEAATPKQSIETVVVTAEHRKQNLQKTSISITALSGDVLAEHAITSVDSALRDVAGVVVQGNANGGGVYIRGVGSGQDTAIGGPSVNLNFDGVYQQQPEVPMSSIYDVERIEVLRGPQGTIYGRNANAGSVNIITANPKNKFEASGSIGWGNYNLLHTEAALNVPIGDTVALRAAMSTERHDGYLKPSGYNDADNTGARVKLLFKPDQNLSLLLASEYLHIGGVGLGAVNALSLHPDDPWQSNAPRGQIDITSRRLYGQLDWKLGFGVLTVIPAHQSFKKYDANVIINNPVATTANSQAVDERQDTLEVRLASIGAEPLQWVTGVYYLNSSSRFDVPPSRIALPATPAVYPYVYGNHAESAAGFAQLTYSVTPALRLIGGLRYTQDKKTALRQASAGAAVTGIDGSWNSTTYKVGAEFDVDRNSMVYANLSTGFKAGGIDQGFFTYKPEQIKALALGSKNRFLGNTLQVNSEAYYYDYSNFQAQYGYRCLNTALCAPVQTYSNRIVNAGTAKLYGAEAEAILRVTQVDRLEANIAYSHSRFDKLVISAGTAAACSVASALPVCALQPDQVLTNQPLANAPEWSGAFAYEHTFDLPNGGDLVARLGTRLYSPYWTNYRRPPQVSAETYVRAYNKSDFFMTYNAPNSKWRVVGYVKNIENKSVVTTAVATAIELQPPRTYGLTVSANF